MISERIKPKEKRKEFREVRAAFTVWNKRIAPVFDTARDFLIVDVEDGRVAAEREMRIPGGENVPEKIEALKGDGVKVVVCGAVSRMARSMIEAQGIKLFAFVSGDIGRVIDGWMNSELAQDCFIMPGCCRRMRRRGYVNQLKTGTGGGGRRGHVGPKCRGV